MYSSILVGYDTSDSAPHILQQALILARSEQAKLDIVTVIPKYRGDLRLLGNTDTLDVMARQYKDALGKARKAAQDAGIRARVHLKEGEADEEIADLARGIGADLVVIGKRARFLWDAMPIGLTAVAIFRQSPVDILVVAGNASLNLDRLFLAYQPSESGDEAARRAASMAASYGASLSIGYIHGTELEAFAMAYQLDETIQRQAEADVAVAAGILEKSGVRPGKVIIKHGSPWYKTLGEEATADGAGLIISGLDHEHGISRLIAGAGIARLVGFSHCPVLVVKER